MTEGIPQQFKITKRYGRSIKTSDGGIASFATELETTVEVDSAEKLFAASEKVYAQAKALTENDIDQEFGKA